MRPARALIDLDALRHNYRLARRLHGGRAFAVLKANAYGHGAIACARALAGEADGFAVAFIDEARALREAGVTAPILLLEGAFDAAELADAARLGLWPAAHHAAQIEMIEKAILPAPLHVWLKVNSGMNRCGFPPGALRSAWERLAASGKTSHIGFMTHFARADEPDSSVTAEQIRVFDAATRGLPGERSLANSGAILAWPDARRDWARPGIMLYGADPLPGDGGSGLIPAMMLTSRVFAVRELAAGEPLGYGGRFVAPRPTRVGLVAMGYADGYPRSAPDGTPVAVDGLPASTIGRVSMDMLTVDLTDLPGAGIGSEVELWGRRVPVNRVAQGVGTISYELLCNVKRVAFEWTGSESGTMKPPVRPS
ncbi:MAG: alanine racemase [Candidatus Accumulibacter sp.]|nr:alanine racemase [Accumulibacter sp.]